MEMAPQFRHVSRRFVGIANPISPVVGSVGNENAKDRP